jgi:hypothetical protein
MFQKYLDRGEMKTGCAGGFCGSGGWRAMGDKLDTGVGNGQVADVWLSLKVSLETFGQVQFSSVQFSSVQFTPFCFQFTPFYFKTPVYGTSHPPPLHFSGGVLISPPPLFFHCRWRPLASPRIFWCSFFFGGWVVFVFGDLWSGPHVFWCMNIVHEY